MCGLGMSELRRFRQVTIDGNQIHSWESFHDVFARAFTFFESYGRNMNAWIDCMSSLDEVDGVTNFALADDEDVLLLIRNFEQFAMAAAEISGALLDCTTFVNRRYEEWNGRARIAIVPV